MIIITNLDTVKIDGVIHGDVVTATLENSKLASEIQAALVKYLSALTVELDAKDADSQAALAALQSTTDAALAAKDEEAIASVAELQAQADIAVAAFQTELSELRSKFDAVEKKLLEPGVSIEEVKAEHDKTEKTRLREELLAKKAEIERQNAEELAAVEQKNADELAEINAAIAAANASPAPPQ